MDFSLSEEQQAVADLADQIFTGTLSNERMKEIDHTDDRFDHELWTELALAGLIAISLPEAHGGAGLDFLASALLCERAGQHVAPVPLLAALSGALAVAEYGTPAQRAALLPAAGAGDAILAPALIEPGTEPLAPMMTARPEGDRWRLDGGKTCIAAGLSATTLLVPARTGEGQVGVFLVDPTEPGVTITRLGATTGTPQAKLELDGAVVGSGDVLGSVGDGAEVLEWIVTHTTSLMSSMMAGVCKGALLMTAEYTKTREQFERPIATFQAVAQRAADAYIDTEAITLTSRQAAWRLSVGMPATEEVAIAKFWAADGGQRVVHAAQHLHGGMGVDRDYPLHRYFLLAKELELTLGGATANLRRLGATMASAPA